MSDLPPKFDLEAFVAATLAEDLGEAGDITSAAVIPVDARFRATCPQPPFPATDDLTIDTLCHGSVHTKGTHRGEEEEPNVICQRIP